MEGTRPLLVEIQALVSSSKYGTGRRMTQGVDQNRVALMIAMLEKRAGMQLLGDDVFVNIAGGLEVDEPAVDLGVVTAIASSFRNQPIDRAHGGLWRSRLDWRSPRRDASICARARSSGAGIQEDRDAVVEYFRSGKAAGIAHRWRAFG